jgi:TRAP-type C4-dicarboxylate transport system permease small subunit
MIAVVTVLLAFPLGYFVKSRLAANTTYAIAYLWAFVFQTLYLTLDVINQSANPAFEPEEFPLSYGVVALAIFGAGFGIVSLGHWVRERRARGRASAATAPESSGVTA